MKLRYRIAACLINLIWRPFFGFRVYNRKNIPDNIGVVVAPNHLTNYDPPLVGAAILKREAFYFAKEELFTVNSFFSWFLRYINAFKVNRTGVDKKAIRHSEELLKRGLCVVMFPEGTRSRKGVLLEVKSGAGYIAARTNVPVIPTYLHGVNTPLIKQVMRKARPTVIFGKPIYPDTYKGKIRVRADKISQDVIQAIRELSEEFDKKNNRSLTG